MVTRVEDKAVIHLANFAKQVDWRRIGLDAAIETCRKCKTIITIHGDSFLETESAADLLTEMIEEVEREILLAHGRYGYVRWLWYLRRLPKEMFEGSLRTTLGYD